MVYVVWRSLSERLGEDISIVYLCSVILVRQISLARSLVARHFAQAQIVGAALCGYSKLLGNY